MNESTCERCQTASGTPHSFHYGKRAGLPISDPPPTYRAVVHGNMHSAWTEHFEVGGLDSVVLCDGCLTRARARRAGRQLLQNWIGVPLVTVLYVLWFAGVVVWAWQGSWSQLALWLGLGVGVTASVYSVLYLMLEREDFAQQTAVELHEDKLRSQGWDAFWTERDFMGLTPH